MTGARDPRRGRLGRKVVGLSMALPMLVVVSPGLGRAIASPYPNLVPAPPQDIRLGIGTTPEAPFSGPRSIRFTMAVANLGDSPFEMIGVPTGSGTQVDIKQCVAFAANGLGCIPAAGWHDAGKASGYWQIPDFAVYELRSVAPDGTPIWSESGLVSRTNRPNVCPYDSGRVRPVAGSGYSTCGIPPRAGISSGWYYHIVDHAWWQHVSIEDVPDGTYALVVKIDAGNRFVETAESDNVSFALVELSNGGTEVRVLS